mmetsp:Transcript_1103/g.2416  ORF Transcript_1103/g.2416 Transcript_1103/m.2416 type:complete len:198 (-) Transcript_1103:2943-3536(-)
MELEYNKIYIQKDFFLLNEIPVYELWRKERVLDFTNFKKIRERKFNGSEKPLHTIYVDKEKHGAKLIDSKPLVSALNGFFYNFSIIPNLEEMEINKTVNNFGPLQNHHILSNKRRKRRKFSSEEERRVARILKNRRTAEESRQRKIQRMKNLENFAITSGEREKKLREEIRYLGKQNAKQNLELILLKRKLNKNQFL